MFHRIRIMILALLESSVLAVTLLMPAFTYASPALLTAAGQGDSAEVEALLDAGANINFTQPNENPKWGYLVSTALEMASGAGHTDVVELLLRRGARTRTDKWYGLYAATWAGQHGHTDIIQLLLKHEQPDAKRLDPLFGPALIGAARNDQLPTVAELLSAGVDPNWHTPGDAFPRPAILESSRTGHEEVFLMLLDAGADPTLYPDILSLTAMQGDHAMVKRLLDMGMDPNDEGDIGQPLALTACTSVSPSQENKVKLNSTIEILLKAGSDVNVPARGRSPLFCARETHNTALVGILEAQGAEEFETMGRKLKRLGWQAIFTIGNH